MPIPGPLDVRFNEVDDLASSVLLQLRTMQHANQRDRSRMRIALRERVQDYVDAVMSTASEIGE